jgi:hypothetical protein
MILQRQRFIVAELTDILDAVHRLRLNKTHVSTNRCTCVSVWTRERENLHPLVFRKSSSLQLQDGYKPILRKMCFFRIRHCPIYQSRQLQYTIVR